MNFKILGWIQWEIFEQLISEILSESLPTENLPKTVFIVGDTKQSIYGFREADPRVMDACQDLFRKFGKEIPIKFIIIELVL